MLSLALNKLFSGSAPTSGGSFGEGTGRIWLDNVECTGSERTLIDCTASSSGVNSCTHAQDAGVRCQPGMINDHSISLLILVCTFFKDALKAMSG